MKILLILLFLVVSTPSEAGQRRRTVRPPASQGFFLPSWSQAGPYIELRGLRVPVHVATPVQIRILEMAHYWADTNNATLRVVSATDHRHQRHSAHYAGLAIDFQGDQLGELAKWFRQWGYKVLWRTPGHWRHVHVERTINYPCKEIPNDRSSSRRRRPAIQADC